MFRNNYTVLAKKFTEGRKPKRWYHRRQIEYYDIVSIDDVQHVLYKKRTKGVITHIGANSIGMRDDQGAHVSDHYKHFQLLDDYGAIIPELINDLHGRALQPGMWIAAGGANGLSVGQVLRFTPTGTVIFNTMIDDRERVLKAPLGSPHCIIIPDDCETVLKIKDSALRNNATIFETTQW